tara:strand:- start:40 stop:1245 length:1206 start_codon:yes stop_codon:yes gene_type:complete
MSTFYTGVDKERYDAGNKFLPQNRFLLNYTAPTSGTEEEEVTTSYGIPATNAFINSGGGGGALQAGNINFDDFNRITTENYMRKQPTPLVDATYNQRIQDTFFGMPTYQQDVNPVDAGEYLAAGQNIPLGLTRAGKIKEGFQNTKEGVAAMMGKIPTLGNFLNKFGIQNFESLSPLDQAFIKQSSGYRGPTVFGENTSGLNKDPFGLNVESLFGNYAEAVRDDVDKLSGHLTQSAEKRGLTFDPVQGALVDAMGNVIEEEDYDTAMIDFMNMNKMNLTRFDFRTQQIKKQKQNEIVQQKNEARRRAEIAKVQNKVNQEERMINELASEKDVKDSSGNVISSTVNPAVDKSYSGGTANPHTDTGWSGSSQSSSSKGKGRDPDDRMATGGRVYLNLGGLASIL